MAIVNLNVLTQSVVQNAITTAADGDTINLPAGTITWTSGSWGVQIVSKSITLAGAGKGTGGTHIIDGLPFTNVDPGSSNFAANDVALCRIYSTAAAGDKAVTIHDIFWDNVSYPSYSHASGYAAPDKSGIRVEGHAVNDYNNNYQGNAAMTQIHIYNCAFNGAKKGCAIYGYVEGCIDHCTFLNCDGGVLMWGDDTDSWNRAITPGTIHAMFIEDCTFTVNNSVSSTPVDHQVYHQEGARSVTRNCVFDLTAYTADGNGNYFFDSHGNQGYYNAGHFNFRGQPLIEIYGNTFKASSAYQLMELRGGSILCYNNTVLTNDGSTPAIELWEEEFWSSGNFGGTLRVNPSYPAEDQINAAFFWNNKVNGTLFDPVAGNPRIGGTQHTGEANCIQINRDYWTKPPDSTTHTSYGQPGSPSAAGYPTLYIPITSYTPFQYPHPMAAAETVISTISYNVFRALGTGTFSLVGSTAPGVTTYSDSGLSPATGYRYEIQAVNAGGVVSSGFSNIVSVSTLAGPNLPSFIQENQLDSGTTQSSGQITYTLPQTLGNLNVVRVAWHPGATGCTVADSSGNTYVAAGPVVVSGIRAQQVWYAKNIRAANANSNIVTATLTGPSPASTNLVIGILEYYGMDTVSPLEVLGTGSSTGATANASITTANPVDMIVIFNYAGDFVTAPAAGFTKRQQEQFNEIEDKLVQVAGLYNISLPLNSSTGWIMHLLAFRTLATTSVSPVGIGSALTKNQPRVLRGATANLK